MTLLETVVGIHCSYFTLLLWLRDDSPLSTSRYQQFPVNIPLLSIAGLMWAFIDKQTCQNRSLLLHTYAFYRCTHSQLIALGFLFLRKFWKWAASHSCMLRCVRTGSQMLQKKRRKKEKLKAFQWTWCICCKGSLKIDAVS